MDQEERRAYHCEDTTVLLLKFNASDQVAVMPLVNMRHFIDPVDDLFMLHYAHLKIDALILAILLLFMHVPPRLLLH